MAVALDPLTHLAQQVEDAATDSDLEPSERLLKLRVLRERLLDLAGRADRYIADQNRLREHETSAEGRLILRARQYASLREELHSTGSHTLEELDGLGFVSHEELDHLAEEGLLEEAVRGLVRRWDVTEERKHPRRQGRWTRKPGGGAGDGAVDQRYRHYFQDHPDAIPAHIERLVPTRQDPPDKRARARKHLNDARAGRKQKRKPLDVRENGDGTLSIIDGNSTYAELKDEGLTHLPVLIGEGEPGEAAVGRTAGDISERAAKAEQSITPLLKTVVPEVGGKLDGLEFRLKSRESIQSKIRRKQEKYPGMTADRAGAKVMDAVRYTAVYPAENYVEGIDRAVSALEKHGLKVVEKRNYWGRDDDYDGVHAIMRGSDDVPIELQFHTPESLNTKQVLNHPLFEGLRESKDSHERYGLWQKMLANQRKVPRPPGIEKLEA